MKTMQWDGTLQSANEVVAWVNANRPDEENPAELVRVGFPHILVDCNNKQTYMTQGKFLLLEEYTYSLHNTDPLTTSS